MRYRLLFLWFEGSQIITQLTANSVWCHLFLEASRRKRSGQWCIPIYHLPSVQFCTAKEFPLPNLRKNLLSIQTTRTKASRTRVLLSRRRLLNHTSPTVGLLRHSHTFSQDELNDLVRDLELSKSKADLLGSRLKQWNLFEKNVLISSFRSHQQLVPSSERKMTLYSVTM